MAAGFIDPNQPKRQPTPTAQSTNPYQGGYSTNYSGYGAGGGNQTYRGYQTGNPMGGQRPSNAAGYANFRRDIGAAHGDADQLGAIGAQWELSNPNAGTNGAEQSALLNMYRGRVGIKNSLAEQMAANPEQLSETESNLNQSAGQALGQGLENTRANFNQRGLLYSGQREMGEQKVKGAVAGELSSGLSGARRESANSMSAAQNAYASVDLANQQDALNRANEAFDTASRNNIARMQAMQQLGEGVGRAAGTYLGSRSNNPNSTNNGMVSGNGRYGLDSNFDQSGQELA